SDMTKGIINRFKVMDISRGAVLNAQVVASMLTSLIAIAAIIGVAFALGFRPAASFPEWLAAIGLVVVGWVATSWLTVALGLAAKTPESAGMAIVPLILLPFLSSAIVPVDKMGPGVRQFAEYQPFTPIIEALRGLLTGEPSAGDAIAALAWCAGIALVGYLWALATYRRRACPLRRWLSGDLPGGPPMPGSMSRPPDHKVVVHARTRQGDIIIQRAAG